MPDEIRINLNAIVRVTLTDAGRRWLRDYHAEIGLDRVVAADQEPREFPLWYAAHVFGPHLYHGNPDVPFVGNEMILVSDP